MFVNINKHVAQWTRDGLKNQSQRSLQVCDNASYFLGLKDGQPAYHTVFFFAIFAAMCLTTDLWGQDVKLAKRSCFRSNLSPLVSPCVGGDSSQFSDGIPQMACIRRSFGESLAFKRKKWLRCAYKSPCKLRLPTLISSFANIHSSEPQSHGEKRCLKLGLWTVGLLWRGSNWQRYVF